MKEIKTIALVDWHWMGHHPTNFTEYALVLAQLGYKVVPFCPVPRDFKQLLNKSLAQRSANLLDKIAPAQPILWPSGSKILSGRWQAAHLAIKHFGSLSNQLRAWEQKTQEKIDLVFFACIYDVNFSYFRFAEPFFRYQWSGLYLHVRSFRMPGSPIPFVGILPCPEKIFTLKSLHSVAILDEGGVDYMKQFTGDRTVVAFPDPTNEELPEPQDSAWGLANKVRTFARNRPVVSLLGHLQRTKGLEEFTRVAQDESLADLVFFLGGEINWDEIPIGLRADMLKVWEQRPNICTHLQRISDEKTLNALIYNSDIVYAAYTDFPNSSGILSKAAAFQRPVLVSDGYLMAERTRAYRLGEVVAAKNIGAIKTALRKLADTGKAGNSLMTGWQEYKKLHSYQSLVSAFSKLLAAPSQPPK